MWAGTPDDPAIISGVRVWSAGDVTRISVDADSDFQFKSSRLTNPDRLFFDISDAHPQTKGTTTVPVDNGLVKRVRVAQTQKEVTRIVLDLEKEADFRTSLLRNPARLVIELRTKGTPVSVPQETPVDDEPAQGEPAHPQPKAERTEVAANRAADSAFTGPRIETRPQFVPRRFTPPPVELLPSPPPPVRKPLPPVDYLTPPPALAAFAAKPAKLPTTTSVLPRLPKYAVVRKAEPVHDPVAVMVPARKNSDGTQSMTRVLGLKLGRVVIDAGHGGHDDGTHGSSGMKEKDLVLDVALRVGALLEQRLGSEVVYTRNDDTFIPLEERTRIANEHRADLFLSIHANSSPDRSVSGIETYYLSMNGAKIALDTASRENASSQHSIYDLKDLLTKIALKDKIDESREFAASVQNSLFSLAQKNGKPLRDRGTKRAPFIVLIGADMPSVLAEIGFLTNNSEETLLRKGEYRDKVAEALYRGIEGYAETLSRSVVARSK